MFSFEGAESPRKYAPVAQLVEQLTLNQWVLGSSPCRCTKWPIGQVVKTAASHAVNIGSNPVWVTRKLEAETLLTYKRWVTPIHKSLC